METGPLRVLPAPTSEAIWVRLTIDPGISWTRAVLTGAAGFGDMPLEGGQSPLVGILGYGDGMPCCFASDFRRPLVLGG